MKISDITTNLKQTVQASDLPEWAKQEQINQIMQITVLEKNFVELSKENEALKNEKAALQAALKKEGEQQ